MNRYKIRVPITVLFRTMSDSWWNIEILIVRNVEDIEDLNVVYCRVEGTKYIKYASVVMNPEHPKQTFYPVTIYHPYIAVVCMLMQSRHPIVWDSSQFPIPIPIIDDHLCSMWSPQMVQEQHNCWLSSLK